jgi:AcrR family transcriptional regulator
VADTKHLIKQTHGHSIKQERSHVTYSALIKAGFKMLEESDLQDISVAELAVEAGYSVGAFYARFRSKDEFFDAMVAEHLDIRTKVQKQLYATLTAQELPGELISNVVNYYWEHRKFWRAVIARSLRDPESWARMRKHRQESTRRFLDAISNLIGRPLTDNEKTNISFAFQVTLGTVDITVVNQPGPLFMGQKLFVEQLTRAFILVSEYESIINGGQKKPKPRKT